MRERKIEKYLIKSPKQMIMIITLFTLIIFVGGTTYAFFNYTRIGSPNTIATGRISFNHTQGNTINLTNVFPISSEEAETDTEDSATVTLTVTGDTDYDGGMEYLVTLSDIVNTVNNKKVPINLEISVTGTGLGTEETGDYYTNRDSYTTSKYKKEYNGTLENGKHILVGYIAPNVTKGTASGINGTINIKAYIDSSKVLISDTYNNGNPPTDAKGTPIELGVGKTVFTTSEWSDSELSFKIKVEAREGIWVEGPLTGSQMVLNAVDTNATGTCENIIYEEDGIKYFSGTNDCINFNYVWYSGKLWRITAIYPNGAMKLITENNITSIAFNESGNVNFENSYMYRWLNEEFYDTLYNASEFIDTSKKWNATMPANTNISTKPLETNMVTANVGLLNSYEYYNSYRNLEGYSDGYLNIKYYWWLLNPYDALYIWYVNYNGRNSSYTPDSSYGVRPSIIIKSGLEFTGNGTANDPYIIVGDKDIGSTNDLINTRLSGEYIKLKNGTTEQLFRIIGVEDNKTKIIAMDYADNKAEKRFATSHGTADSLWGSGSTTGEGTWYTYLNTPTTGYYAILQNTYGDLFTSGIYYLGTCGYNYKLSVCANTTSGNTKSCNKTSDAGTFNVGVPRYGEMFATQQSGGYSNSIYMWLMNRYSESRVWYAGDNGSAYYNFPDTGSCARPTLHLKSTVKILSGSGTELDPYVVGL